MGRAAATRADRACFGKSANLFLIVLLCGDFHVPRLNGLSACRNRFVGVVINSASVIPFGLTIAH